MMSNGTIVIAGVAVAANLLVIHQKIKRERYSDAALDGFLLVMIAIVFSGTISGLMIGTVASSIVSIYLWFSPPKEYFKDIFDSFKDITKDN
jgi:hypothetical protein